MNRDVIIYDANSILFSEEDSELTELPPIPEDVVSALEEIGGYCDGKPNLRVVSGLDPELMEFVGGEWRLKYAIRKVTEVNYDVLHGQDGKKRILTPAESKVMSGMKNLKGIIIPVSETKIEERGIPRYFLEYYKPPEMFGTEEEWEAERYGLTTGEESTLDLMGEYPREGVYATWFCIDEPIFDESTGKVVRTTFRAIDDIVLAYIAEEVSKISTKYASEQHTEQRKEIDSEYSKHKEGVKEQIRDIVSSHINRLVK